MQGSFTLPIALTPKKTLLIGAGNVAKQKHIALKESKWEVQIIARERKDSYFENFNVEIGEVQDSLLQGFELVIDASGDENSAHFYGRSAKSLGIF